MIRQLISDKFINTGLKLAGGTTDLLASYYSLVIEYNGKFNLTRITSPSDFIEKNIFDSLYLLKFILNNDSSILDIGTGFGVPGILMKILRPDLEVYLLDSSEKKCNFLSLTINALKLKNIKILNCRAESLGSPYLNYFDYIVSRAFGHLLYLSEVSIPYLKLNGTLICQKSTKQETEVAEAKKHISLLGGNVLKVENYQLYNTGIDRSVYIINKVQVSPNGYPRPFNKINKDLKNVKKSIVL